MLSRTLLCLAVVSASTPLLADTVWLKNGDKLSGKITVFDGGKLLIQTEYAGAVPIDWKQVKTLESDQQLLVKQDAYTGEKAKALHAAEDGKVTLANGDGPKTVELASIQQILKPKPVVEDLVWKGNVDAALDYQRAEKDTDDYDIDFKTTARHGKWRHTAEGEYNREFQDDVVTTDNWRAEYSLDRFLTEKWFWQGRLNYKRDKVEELARQRTVGTGPGYQFWDDELGVLFDTSSDNANTWTGLTVDANGVITAGLTVSGLTSGYSGTLIMGGNILGGTSGDIYLHVIPEPEAAMLGGIGMLVLQTSLFFGARRISPYIFL